MCQLQSFPGDERLEGGRILTVKNGWHPLGESHWRVLMSVTQLRSQPGSVDTSAVLPTKVTTGTLLDKKHRAEPITALTAYDYAFARIVDEAGVDMVLVGDSLAMVVMGLESTLAVTMDEMLHHTRAARRAVKRALLVADMPFGSYQSSVEQGVANAVRFLKEAGAEAVKIEGPRPGLVERLTAAEIPVVGHLGLTPQSVHRMGGYKVQGKTQRAIKELRAAAKDLEQAGICALVLEGMPRELAAEITAELAVPTIGIGAGPDCDGQILVSHDLLNLTFAPAAKFVRRYGDAAALFRTAIAAFREDVVSRQYPSDAESYHLPAETRPALHADAVTTRRKA
jgi:3-methyl-2-oxobutanoate hydroxymethyltransferase